MKEVTLEQMLVARENRALRQRELLEQFGKPLVCFTMNIPGPVKDSPLIRRSFRWGLSVLEERLGPVLYRDVDEGVTGCTAMLSVDMPPEEVKGLCVEAEESCPMGRLWDMDVLNAEGEKLDREPYGGGSRDCIVCGKKGRGCASRRVHTVPELQKAARDLMAGHFQAEDAEAIGALAAQSLLDELYITPKPGLVDRNNSGSHRDMNFDTFVASASALEPYFIRCASIGMESREIAPEETFRLLRQEGIRAERVMLEATGGVNTHKGAIFSMGLLCGSAGRLWDGTMDYDGEALCREVAAMAKEAMERDFRTMGGSTAGERLYARSGVRGARGEAAAGLPSVWKVGLPVFRKAMEEDSDMDRAGAITLLNLISRVEDTNLLHRGGEEKAEEAARRCREVLEQFSMEKAEQLDRWFIKENLSPGGCADLLAAVCFLRRICPPTAG